MLVNLSNMITLLIALFVLISTYCSNRYFEWLIRIRVIVYFHILYNFIGVIWVFCDIPQWLIEINEILFLIATGLLFSFIYEEIMKFGNKKPKWLNFSKWIIITIMLVFLLFMSYMKADSKLKGASQEKEFKYYAEKNRIHYVRRVS